MSEFSYMTALEIAALVRSKQVSPGEVVAASLARLNRLEPQLNAFVTIAAERAMAAARGCEKQIMAGEETGALLGVPMSVKDLIAVKGLRFTSGSRTLADNVADVDAPSVERIEAAGACILGKTTTTEFGCKTSSDSPLTGVTRNPWNLTKTTGGSSAGAAATVAAGVYPVALGTDGGGSVRIPSCFCGLFGIKPQFGRVPIHPTIATPTLGHVGPIARTVRDAAAVLSVIAGFDSRDPSSVSEPVPDFLAACDRPPAGLRIAWSPTLGYGRPSAEVLELATSAVRAFEEFGCVVEEIETVFGDPVDLWMAEFYAGVGTRLAEPLMNDSAILDPTLVEVLATALDQSILDYYRKVFGRYQLRDQVRLFFENHDLLLTPTLPVTAFDADMVKPPEFPDDNLVSWMSYTYPFNLTGHPAASVPCGFTKEGLPAGLQIVAPMNREVDIFRAAAAFESARPWAQHKPEVGAGQA